MEFVLCMVFSMGIGAPLQNPIIYSTALVLCKILRFRVPLPKPYVFIVGNGIPRGEMRSLTKTLCFIVQGDDPKVLEAKTLQEIDFTWVLSFVAFS